MGKKDLFYKFQLLNVQFRLNINIDINQLKKSHMAQMKTKISLEVFCL